ncbi:MAG: hypothetical protein BMS9Abin20_0222 [Acidimicrobiia bacterium]|nr:MAG: hypothetical protein BMS9Abin20_0222 [Acidimicrobiia bacterium]
MQNGRMGTPCRCDRTVDRAWCLIVDIVAEIADVRGITRDELLGTVRFNMTRLIEDDDNLRSWMPQLNS